jgi:phosphate transport system permease protein
MRVNIGDFLFASISRIMAFSVLIILSAIFITLIIKSMPAIDHFGIQFFTDQVWAPNMEIFGAAPSIYGTIVSTILAIVIATPIAIGIAIFLTEIAHDKLKGTVGTLIELLAAIPSVIFGGNGLGLLTAGLVLAIMIIPFTASISRDSMNTTPDILKESAYALGATKWDVIKDVVIPYAKIGIIGSIIISLGRALGETMAVTFVMGSAQRIPSSLVEPATSIPVTLANQFTEADADLYFSSLYYLALILFIVSFAFIAVAKFLFLNKAGVQK